MALYWTNRALPRRSAVSYVVLGWYWSALTVGERLWGKADLIAVQAVK